MKIAAFCSSLKMLRGWSKRRLAELVRIFTHISIKFFVLLRLCCDSHFSSFYNRNISQVEFESFGPKDSAGLVRGEGHVFSAWFADLSMCGQGNFS